MRGVFFAIRVPTSNFPIWSQSYWEIACFCYMTSWWNKQFHENVLIHRSGTVGFWSGFSIASTLTSPVSWVWRSWLMPLGVWLDSVDSLVPQKPPKIWVSFKVQEKAWKQKSSLKLSASRARKNPRCFSYFFVFSRWCSILWSIAFYVNVSAARAHGKMLSSKAACGSWISMRHQTSNDPSWTTMQIFQSLRKHDVCRYM